MSGLTGTKGWRMSKRQKRTLDERWSQIMAAYRRRHRTWTMEVLPQMPEADWKQYIKWVGEFGATSMAQTGRNSRKVKRQLKAARATRQKGGKMAASGAVTGRWSTGVRAALGQPHPQALAWELQVKAKMRQAMRSMRMDQVFLNEAQDVPAALLKSK